jgi:hypothetical protein
VSFAATGNSPILGHSNSANKVTTIRNTGKGAALSLITKKSTAAPFTTNAIGQVAHLNASKVDGLTASQIAAKSAQVSSSGVVVASTGGFTVTNPVGGLYCIAVSGVNPVTRPAVVSTNCSDDTTVAGTPGNIAYAEIVSTSSSCGSARYQIQTYEVHPGTTTVSGSTTYTDQGFSIVLP